MMTTPKEYRIYRSAGGDMRLWAVPALIEGIGECTAYMDEDGNCFLTLPPGGAWIDDADVSRGRQTE